MSYICIPALLFGVLISHSVIIEGVNMDKRAYQTGDDHSVKTKNANIYDIYHQTEKIAKSYR